jgi:enoyl-CoA hydratase
MELSCFTYQVQANVGHLVLNRPAALNTMSPVFWRELETLLGTLHRDSASVRALVISSTGKHFSAGMALETFGGSGAIAMDDSTAAGRANIVDELLDMQQVFNQLEALRLPVICAIHGGCIGGALDMAAACDIRWCTADAFFCIQEINIGMVADLGSLQRLPKLMSHSLLRELAYTGRRLPAAKALASGLVSEVFDTQEQMLEAALACAAEIATKPPVAMAGSKRALNYARDHSVRDSLEQMALLQAGFWQTDNLKLAIGARKGEAAQFEDLRPIQRFADR